MYISVAQLGKNDGYTVYRRWVIRRHIFLLHYMGMLLCITGSHVCTSVCAICLWIRYPWGKKFLASFWKVWPWDFLLHLGTFQCHLNFVASSEMLRNVCKKGHKSEKQVFLLFKLLSCFRRSFVKCHLILIFKSLK